MRFKNLDLIFILIVVAINVVWTQIPVHNPLVGIIFALPLILFLPGYALTQILFRRRTSEEQEQSSSPLASPRPDLQLGHPIGRSDQLLLSFGLSIAIDVLVGFGLNILPIGLQALSWVLSLGLITLLCTLLVAFLRRKDLPKTGSSARLRITLQDCLLLGLAFLVGASAIWLSFIRPLQPQPSFTQFWMLPANQANKVCAVSVGVQSFETTSETYQIVLTVNHTPMKNWSSVVLIPQQKWTQSVPVTPGTANTLYIEAQLYLADKPSTVYRDVHLTFYISSSNTNGLVQYRCVIGS